MKALEIGRADPRWVAGANARLSSDLVEVLGAFAARGVEPILLKGAALLATVYAGDPGSRPMNDLDLLVRPHERAPARAGLGRLGFEAVLSRGFEFRRGETRIDLHADLWHLERRDLARFRGRARRVAVESRPVLVPDSTDHCLLVLLHAAVRHAELRPHWVEDLRRLAAGDVDWRRVLGGVRRVRAEVPVRLWLERAALVVPRSFRSGLGGPGHRPLHERFYRRLLEGPANPDACELGTHLFHPPPDRRLPDLVRYILPDGPTLRRRYGGGPDVVLRMRRLVELARRARGLLDRARSGPDGPVP